MERMTNIERKEAECEKTRKHGICRSLFAKITEDDYRENRSDRAIFKISGRKSLYIVKLDKCEGIKKGM